jgi:hypothetical protein
MPSLAVVKVSAMSKTLTTIGGAAGDDGNTHATAAGAEACPASLVGALRLRVAVPVCSVEPASSANVALAGRLG